MVQLQRKEYKNICSNDNIFNVAEMTMHRVAGRYHLEADGCVSTVLDKQALREIYEVDRLEILSLVSSLERDINDIVNGLIEFNISEFRFLRDEISSCDFSFERVLRAALFYEVQKIQRHNIREVSFNYMTGLIKRVLYELDLKPTELQATILQTIAEGYIYRTDYNVNIRNNDDFTFSELNNVAFIAIREAMHIEVTDKTKKELEKLI